MDTGIQQSVKQLVVPKAPVKSITKFREIRPQMFLSDSMIGAGNECFGVTDESMHPAECLTQVRLIGFHPCKIFDG